MLYKHTIVIWSELGQMDDLATIGGAADCGDAYCAKYEVDQVEDPSKDPDWDGTEFFGVDEGGNEDEAPHPLLVHLRDFEACQDAVDWLKTLPPETTPFLAYSACPRGDWLVWLALRAGVDVIPVARAVCVCLRNALPLWEKCYPSNLLPSHALREVDAALNGVVRPEALFSFHLALNAAARRAHEDTRVFGGLNYLLAPTVPGGPGATLGQGKN